MNVQLLAGAHWKATLLCVAVVLASCGGDDSASETTATSEPRTTTTTEATTTTTEASTTTEAVSTTTGSPCADEKPSKNNTGGYVLICQEDYGEEWPFTVSDGLLSCRTLETLETGGGPAIVFGPGDKAYAVNGSAKAVAAENDWLSVDEIWRDDPATPGLKVSLQPIISDGLDLCP